MEQDDDSGGPRGGSSAPLEARDLTVRLLLAERAIAESATRIAELTQALAQLTDVGQPSAAGQTLVVDADAVSPFSLGFYHRELDKLGRPFRWTGRSDVFEFRLRLNRNVSWSFEMEVQPNPNVDTKKLRGFVDFIEIPVEIDDAGKTVKGLVPERYFGTSATVTFLLPNTYVPSTVNPSVQDNRTLGLIFYELRAKVRPSKDDASSGEHSNLKDPEAARAESGHEPRRGATQVSGDTAETTS
jgi:hypothetical protein